MPKALIAAWFGISYGSPRKRPARAARRSQSFINFACASLNPFQ